LRTVKGLIVVEAQVPINAIYYYRHILPFPRFGTSSSALVIETAVDVDIYHDVPQLCAEKPAVYAAIVDVLFIPGKFCGGSTSWCRTI
jgi:hypothetical protein